MTPTETEALTRYLNLTPAEAETVITKLTPEQRATYLRIGKFVDDWNLYCGFTQRRTTRG